MSEPAPQSETTSQPAATLPQAASARPLRRARILTRAERSARDTRAAAVDEIAALREAARAEGYRAGLEAAERDAAERLLGAAIETGEWIAAIEARLVEAAMRAVERVIGEMDNVTLTRRVARTALAEFRGVGAVALHVAPSAADELRETVEDIVAPFRGQLGALEIIEIVADPSVGPGGAVLRGATGVVDARIETQLAALRASLETAFESRLAADGDAEDADEDGDSGGEAIAGLAAAAS